MTGYEIVVYPPRAVHMGTREADMLSHLNAVEGTLQATRATEHVEVIQGRRSRWITYQDGMRIESDGMRIESALPALEASE